jgi:hypothetical protein
MTTMMSRGLLLGLLLVSMLFGSGCSDEKQPAAGDQSPRERQIALTQRIAQIQEQVAQLEKQAAELRAEQNRRLDALHAQSQALTQQFMTLKQDLAGDAVAAPAPLPAVDIKVIPPAPQASEVPLETPAPVKDSNPIMRFILVVILLVALWFIVKIFMGRWAAEDDLTVEAEDEDEGGEDDDLPEDETVQTDLGSITISPEARPPVSRSDENGEK